MQQYEIIVIAEYKLRHTQWGVSICDRPGTIPVDSPQQNVKPTEDHNGGLVTRDKNFDHWYCCGGGLPISGQ